MNNLNTMKNARLISAILVLIGIFASGPIGSWIVQMINPEPQWVDAKTYIQNYTELQAMPFFFGFLLMLGFILFFASLPKPETDFEEINAKLIILFASLYTFMISLNYMIQIVLVPNMLENEKAIDLLATPNAKSLFWYIEMTGYGFLGLATWSSAYLFSKTKNEIIIRWLLIANGIISVLGAVLTFIFKGWVLTIPGLVSYVLWNILVMLVMIFVLVEYRAKKT
ncbi:TPA: hypothetical protein ENS27_09520 [bacterium]|nr:hypothetical protein [bacterium]